MPDTHQLVLVGHRSQVAGRVVCVENRVAGRVEDFGDAALVEMSRAKPANEEEFLAVNGVGKVKLERYGEAFLEVIAGEGTF